MKIVPTLRTDNRVRASLSLAYRIKHGESSVDQRTVVLLIFRTPNLENTQRLVSNEVLRTSSLAPLGSAILSEYYRYLRHPDREWIRSVLLTKLSTCSNHTIHLVLHLSITSLHSVKIRDALDLSLTRLEAAPPPIPIRYAGLDLDDQMSHTGSPSPHAHRQEFPIPH